jgi:hypothetical protein
MFPVTHQSSCVSLCRLQDQGNESLMLLAHFSGEWNMKILAKMKVGIIPDDFLQLRNDRIILSPEN